MRGFAVTLVVLLAAGCDPPKPVPKLAPGGLQPAGAPANSPARQTGGFPTGLGGIKTVEPAALVAAKKGDEFWTQEEVENWLRQDLSLIQVTLRPQADYGFSGEGIAANGNKIALEIKQVPGGIKCSYHDQFGGSGEMAFGKLADVPGAQK